MKHFIILVIFISMWSFSIAESIEITDNPASLAYNNRWELELPLLNYELNLDNSLLNLDNLDIFDKSKYDNGHIMSNQDKEILTKDDLVLYGAFGTTLVGARYKNFGIKFSGYGKLYAPVLDKKYAQLALYGNETNKIYQFDSGENSRGYVFLKTVLSYAIPREFNLGSLLRSESSWLNIPFNIGFNLNTYYPGYYAEMKKSSQTFGSLVDSLFYDYEALYYYYDDKSSGRLSLGLGFGLMSNFGKGRFDFHLDDLFGSLQLNDLAGGEYRGEYSDYLLYFHADDYEPFDTSTENDSLRIKKRSYKFSPSIFIGFKYDLYKGIKTLLNYQNSNYLYPNGVSMGVEYAVIDKIPLGFKIGKDENIYFRFNSGLEFRNVSFGFAFTSYYGFFNHARGLGIESSLKIRFN